MLARFLLPLFAALALALPAAAAPPLRDEALRLAPHDFALVAVVQNFRDHAEAVAESPFAAWFPATALGKRVLGGANIAQATDAATPVFAALGTTPSEVLQDVVGDAVVFAFTPAADGDPAGERSVFLVRPRKPDVLARVVEKLNASQIQSKELKAVVERKHAGAAYFERQRPDAPPEFYAFCGGVFVFAGAEAEVKAVLDRDRAAPADTPPVLSARMAKLGVKDAAAVVLLNPRALDAELAAKVKAAQPDERPFLTRFAAIWAAADAAAVYLNLDTSAELGVSVQFDPAKVPANARSWLVGVRTPSAVWAVVPDDAIAAVAGRVKAGDVFDVLSGLNPPDKPSVRAVVEEALGPVVGKDKLPLVLDALGPDWGAWVQPPAKGAKEAVPVAVAAVKVRADGEKGAEAVRALAQSLEYGFQVARIAYNSKHADQIALGEEKDGDAVIKVLSGDGLPPGLRPCFALKDGYLLLSTSPDAIRAFRAPPDAPKPGDALLARFSGSAARTYLGAHGGRVAKLLSAAGAGGEKELAGQLAVLSQALEPLERVELVARGDATGVKLALRFTPTKPLKK
jgi:hypothetical protein